LDSGHAWGSNEIAEGHGSGYWKRILLIVYSWESKWHCRLARSPIDYGG